MFYIQVCGYTYKVKSKKFIARFDELKIFCHILRFISLLDEIDFNRN